MFSSRFNFTHPLVIACIPMVNHWINGSMTEINWHFSLHTKNNPFTDLDPKRHTHTHTHRSIGNGQHLRRWNITYIGFFRAFGLRLVLGFSQVRPFVTKSIDPLSIQEQCGKCCAQSTYWFSRGVLFDSCLERWHKSCCALMFNVITDPSFGNLLIICSQKSRCVSSIGQR